MLGISHVDDLALPVEADTCDGLANRAAQLDTLLVDTATDVGLQVQVWAGQD